MNRWSVGFTKPMIDYEILADSQHYWKHLEVLFSALFNKRDKFLWLPVHFPISTHQFPFWNVVFPIGANAFLSIRIVPLEV